MNMNLLLEQLKELFTTKYKKLLAALAIFAGACVFGALAGLLLRLYGIANLMWRLFGLFNGLPGKAALFLVAYQCAGKYKAEKNPMHLAAAILLAVQGFSGFEHAVVWGMGTILRMLPMPVALALLCLDDFRGEDEEKKMMARMMIIVVGGATLLQVIAGFFYFRYLYYAFPWILASLLLILSNAALLAEAAILVLQASKGEYSPVITKETTAAATAAVTALVAKLTGKDAGEKAEKESEMVPVVVEEPKAVEEPKDAATELSPEALEKAVAAALGQKSFGGLANPGDWEYKTVPGPAAVTVNKNEDYAHGVEAYAVIMQQESVGGWEFSHMERVPVTKQVGCLAALLGQGNTTVFFNMLVFKRRK